MDRERARRVAERFRERFGAEPRVFVASGRLNLLGEHVDYHGGPVLPVAMDRGVCVAARARSDGRLRLVSLDFEPELEVALDSPPPPSALGWAAYPVAAVLEAVRGRARNGFDLAFGGDLPIGAGLSSSAAILVAVIHAARAILGLETDPVGVARAAHRAESEAVGVRCGIMDPFAIALGRPGHALWLDCRDGSHEWVPIAGAPADLVVLDSGTRRSLLDGRYNERVAESSAALEKLRARLPGLRCLAEVTAAQLEESQGGLGELELRRARHVVSEVGRVRRGREHLRDGELREFGRLLLQSHRSLRDDYEVSTDRLDALVEIASAREDCFGARLTGAGFGGCAFALVRGGAAGPFGAAVGEAFERRFGERPAIHAVGTGGGVEEWREW